MNPKRKIEKQFIAMVKNTTAAFHTLQEGYGVGSQDLAVEKKLVLLLLVTPLLF